MRFLFTLLAIAALGAGVFTACKSVAQQSNRQQAQNTNSLAAITETAVAPQPAEPVHTDDGIARISLAEAKKAFDDGKAIFVDTRAAQSYEAKHIKGALNIPAEEFQTRYAEVPKNKQIITYCS